MNDFRNGLIVRRPLIIKPAQIIIIREYFAISAGVSPAFNTEQHRVYYVRRSFQREPDFGVTSISYGFAELLTRAEMPR